MSRLNLRRKVAQPFAKDGGSCGAFIKGPLPQERRRIVPQRVTKRGMCPEVSLDRQRGRKESTKA
ncbi:uncharacterized protein B0I36DRAFT_328202 [Microdochium trichocladiopsis]|uniref:Uncharacterized protein n=1 Tax=Microdochium trichocladiopsis TaxID=1682393 RepID=A0A9P8Y2I3_9PEZI|nr:uncharacterized protein B0I36DRAFT_328202 [Microdochium trichocladiopsis]KAH7027916.1 hypothetical protein B0I36DRAFT_328202 [Microdochium trichocladiopsis]